MITCAEDVASWEELADEDDADPVDDWETLADEPEPGVRQKVVASRPVDPAKSYSEETLESVKRLKAGGNISYSLIAAAVQYISDTAEDEGAILIFMPGMAEIKRYITPVPPALTHHARCIKELGRLNVKERLQLLPLHSSVSSSDQAKVLLCCSISTDYG